MDVGNGGVPDQHCIKVSPIEFILQYCFAMPKPLKNRPGTRRCETAPLCKSYLRGIFLLWPWNQKNRSEQLTRKLRPISGARSLMNDVWFR